MKLRYDYYKSMEINRPKIDDQFNVLIYVGTIEIIYYVLIMGYSEP